MTAGSPSPTDMRPVVVPVGLGCCPDDPRCLLCAPPPAAPAPDVVAALVDNYRSERDPDAKRLRVGFYGGPPPADALLDQIDGLPFVARVRPDLLSRADAERLARRGCVGIELDALTFYDPALAAVGRRYRAVRTIEQLRGVRALGVAAGIVLAPGLPGTSHAVSVRDAEVAAELATFARIHPVLVLDGSGLHRAHLDGQYVPLGLGEAVTTCRAMLDVLLAAGVDVVRVGQNPGPDGLGRALAGPRHPALRQLCDARRTLAVLHARLAGARPGSTIAIRCNPADETHTRGPFNQHVRTLRAAYSLAELRVRPDPTLPRGEYALTREEPE